MDNDGYLDIYLGTGDPSYSSLVPNVLLHNKEGKTFVDITASSGTGELHKGHGVAFADIDNDGDEDILTVIGGATPGDSHAFRLFENPGHGNDWISLRLVGVKANRSAIGARIKVTVKNEGGEPRSDLSHGGQRRIVRRLASGTAHRAGKIGGDRKSGDPLAGKHRAAAVCEPGQEPGHRDQGVATEYSETGPSPVPTGRRSMLVDWPPVPRRLPGAGGRRSLPGDRDRSKGRPPASQLRGNLRSHSGLYGSDVYAVLRAQRQGTGEPAARSVRRVHAGGGKRRFVRRRHPPPPLCRAWSGSRCWRAASSFSNRPAQGCGPASPSKTLRSSTRPDSVWRYRNSPARLWR